MGCSMLSQENCKLIGLNCKIMRRQLATLKCPIVTSWANILAQYTYLLYLHSNIVLILYQKVEHCSMTDSACDTTALDDDKLHTWTDWLGDLISLTELDVSYCELLKSQQTAECCITNVRPAFFYIKTFLDNYVAIWQTFTSYCLGSLFYSVKFQRWMLRTF